MESPDIFSSSSSADCGDRGYFLVKVHGTQGNYTFEALEVHCKGSHVVPQGAIPAEIQGSISAGEILKVCCVSSST